MKILVFTDLKNIEKSILNNIYKFLNKYISEGTVEMPATVYDSANMWTVVVDDYENVLGFSAQKCFKYKYYNIVQIMATFLDPAIRGKKFASLLIQGKIFTRLWLKNFIKPIFWCTRTRMPAAYAAASKYNTLYPSLDNVIINRNNFEFARNLANLVYGENILLDRDTYVMKDSYQNVIRFIEPSSSSKQGKISRFFKKNIDYKNNETLFVYSKLKLSALVTFILTDLMFMLEKSLSFYKKKLIFGQH